MLSLFFSYSHADEELRDQLEQQLAILKRQKVISVWHDRRILAGSEIDHSIDAQLEAADIILLLVSPAFLASDYCYDREMTRAMERHHAGGARVIPVILRPCAWHDAPFGKLMATPTDGKPVTLWPDRDQAFLEVTNAIKAAAKTLGDIPGAPPAPTGLSNHAALDATTPAPRSSNLRLAKTFTERDKDAFKLESFEYMAKFFENSLNELQSRNDGIEGTFRRIDANRFSAVIYRSGKTVARCTVFMGSHSFIDGIAYSANDTPDSNSFNECLSVHSDDQMLYLKGMGMGSYMRQQADTKLSQEGASELYWGMFIEPLQRR
ncbi:toll/interleukin-1 receptor domain-containing protein [Sphingopyxis sp. GC21]|uniref:toll/interleukin-1 receptor domain-containing protein n=1 Tax=Sphingopyxis sp. GC21 TaxID=2933562 RepID=UPI0021E4FA6F|nr:toll/interleukin-1 receptor domain-containing protein [Sphingopyxis sp. GC21]